MSSRLKLLPALLLASALVAPGAFAKAVYGEWGLVLSDQNTAVKPGDDFYMFVNGGWDKRTQIPPDRASTSDGHDIYERAEADLKTIAENAKNAASGSTERKVGDFYASFMDQAAMDTKGIAPVQSRLDAINAIATPADLARVFGAMMTEHVDVPFGVYIDADAKAPTRYAAYVYQSGLGLPDRDYYLKDTPENEKYRAAYKAYIEKVLGLAGIADGKAKAETIYALETEIAKIHWSLEDSRDTVKTYNPADAAGLATAAPGFDWAAWLDAAQLNATPNFVMVQNTALAGLAALAQKTPLDTWKAYLAFHQISAAAPYLTKALEEASFDFYDRTLNGQEVQRDRWKRALGLIDTMMGEAMGEAYVKLRFPPSSKAMMTDMVANLKTALGQMIDEAGWLDDATKGQAHTKLDRMGVKIGYPDTWRDYASLDIKPDDAFGNVVRAVQFDWARQTARIAGPIDRSEWGMTPPTVNAYNSPVANEIVFPAGILQPPYFDPEADLAVNYGATGATIGHEISHGFDDQGRQYDETGAIRDWWTSKDAEAYIAEAKKLIAQYNAYEPLPGLTIRGENTQGENIADLAGLAIAYRAYHLALGGKDAPVIDGLTGDQRFFMAYAMSWRTKMREDALRQQLVADEHAPPYYRVNGIVRNFGPWYDAFGITPDAKMYLAPENRARLW